MAFPADEFVQFVQARFLAAKIERTSNHLGTTWIEISTTTGHAEIVATVDGTIGATDIAHDDTGESISFAPFAVELKSVDEARDFIVKTLSHAPK